MNYYVIEIQTNHDGTSGNFVFGFSSKNDAEAKYLGLRQSALISSVMLHTIVWIDNKGNMIDRKAYVHPIPTPEPEGEEE